MLQFSLYIVGILSMLTTSQACGSYVKIPAGGRNYISTNNYGPYLHCIWWFETDAKYLLSLNITYQGDVNFGRCGDYIKLYDGVADSDVLCDITLTNYAVNATASWMRVEFVSDGINTTYGFQAIIASIFVGSVIDNYSSPIRSCKSYEMKCSNKVCMTLSNRCDGFNDCGCDENCDEDNCSGLSLSKNEIIIIGSFAGLAIFAVFFIMSFAWESHLKRRALSVNPEAKAEIQDKKAADKKYALYKKTAKEKAKKDRQ